MKIKARQIAHDLGVSTATVSLAVNDKPGVNEATKRKILDYIEQLEREYGAKEQKDKFVKMLLYVGTNRYKESMEQKFISDTFVEISALLQKKGMELRMYSVNGSDDVLKALKESCDDGTSGIIFLADDLPEKDLELLNDCYLPLVVCDNMLHEGHWDAVNMHNQRAIYSGMRHLEKCGCKDIIYVQNSEDIYNFRERRKSFRRYANEEMKEGITVQMIEAGNEAVLISHHLIGCLKERSKFPDAIFAENFTVTVGVVRALENLKVKIPEDISVIGIDEVPGMALLPVELTCFSPPHASRAAHVVKRLFDKMEFKGTNAVEVLVGMEFVKGESVKW